MSESYISSYASDIREFSNVAEKRTHDEIDFEELVRDNRFALEECIHRKLPYCLIDRDYNPGKQIVASLSGDDAREAALLFRETVHNVNARDYASEQIAAWAPCCDEFLDAMAEKIGKQCGIVVRECGIIIGFGTLDESGDIDMLYVHKDRQGQGIGGRILFELEAATAASGKASVFADVSLTARPFFERMGYETICRKTVKRCGVELANFRMVKQLF